MYSLIFLILCLALPAALATTFTFAGGAPCNTSFDCSLHGSCEDVPVDGITSKRCVCTIGFAKPDCSYTQFSKSLCGGLQIGLTFASINGVGNFILGHTGHAVGQLILGLITWVVIIPATCVAACLGKSPTAVSAALTVAWCIMCTGTFSGAIWNIVDGAKMLGDSYLDANGFPLA